ncbi:surface lipoprotein assembly modifier, partial [Aggregatibacter sp.]
MMPQPVVANTAQQISITKQTGGIQLTQQDLEKNLALTENLINQALIGSQWDLLADLLLVYQRIPHADQNLYRYAKGALLRAQRKHSDAIQNYHDILVANPDLPYVRFDYMAMLFENKQFKQAQKESEKLSNTPLPTGLQQLIQQYQHAMKNAQSWQFDGNLLYEKTNNVNNASNQREIRLGNRTFIRDEKALPQSANGLRYAASLTRAKNLEGNHFIFSKIGADGIYYWDNRKYNEERTKLQLGYQYQDIVKSFHLLPTVEFEWYSGHFYNRKYG